jgi:hypothetical protein
VSREYTYTAPSGARTWKLYGCAKRGCDRINLDYMAYGAYGKSWCLKHPPLRIRLRRWLGEDV